MTRDGIIDDVLVKVERLLHDAYEDTVESDGHTDAGAYQLETQEILVRKLKNMELPLDVWYDKWGKGE